MDALQLSSLQHVDNNKNKLEKKVDPKPANHPTQMAGWLFPLSSWNAWECLPSYTHTEKHTYREAHIQGMPSWREAHIGVKMPPWTARG